jgi:hypothetical protein
MGKIGHKLFNEDSYNYSHHKTIRSFKLITAVIPMIYLDIKHPYRPWVMTYPSDKAKSCLTMGGWGYQMVYQAACPLL